MFKAGAKNHEITAMIAKACNHMLSPYGSPAAAAAQPRRSPAVAPLWVGRRILASTPQPRLGRPAQLPGLHPTATATATPQL